MTVEPDLAAEYALCSQGYRYIAGIDEAGRGAWAGPVVAAAVVLPLERRDLRDLLSGIRDSKLMTPHQRDIGYDLILACAVAYGVGVTAPDIIDRIGIVAATREAMCQAVQQLSPVPDYLLIDAVRLPDLSYPQTSRYKADRLHLSVAAASVLAKVTRDRLMVALDSVLPGYGMAQHKGYGTGAHRAVLTDLGPTVYHRHSFRPIRKPEGCDDC